MGHVQADTHTDRGHTQATHDAQASTKAKIKTFQKSEITADLPENYVWGFGPHTE